MRFLIKFILTSFHLASNYSKVFVNLVTENSFYLLCFSQLQEKNSFPFGVDKKMEMEVESQLG